MLAIQKNRVGPFFAILALAASVPIIGSRVCDGMAIWCLIIDWICRAIFPFQVFPVANFILDYIAGYGFLFSYVVYLAIVCLIMLKIIWREEPLLSRKNFILFIAVCLLFYVINWATFSYQVNNFIHALPPEPAILNP